MLVSIIIPVYNVAPYIEDCLRSVMRQTYAGPMECLIVDDCGTDESISIAKRMIAEYDGPIRFEILHHDHNRGLSAARNTGTMAAKGEYVYYLDSDDFIADNCIEIMMGEVIANPSVEMVQGNGKLYQEKSPTNYTRVFPVRVTHSNEDSRTCFFHGQIPVNAWNKLVSRALIADHQLYFKEGLLYEDVLWQFYMMKYVKSISFLSDITYVHRKRPGSIMTSTDVRVTADHYVAIYKDIIDHLTQGHEREELNHYGKCSAGIYHLSPSFYPMKEVFRLYGKKAKQMKLSSTWFEMTLVYYLGCNTYGKVIMALLGRLKHPDRIPGDFHRLFLKIKPCKNE